MSEWGSTTVATPVYFDWHSSGPSGSDFDVRFTFNGGNAGAGQGSFDIATSHRLSISGNFRANGTIRSDTGLLATYALPGQNAHVWFYDNVGASRGIIYWEAATNNMVFGNSSAGINAVLDGSGRWGGCRGFLTHTEAYAGGSGANCYNYFWDGSLKGYVDDVYLGVCATISDYRIKKDVLDLPSMWETTKQLRPIKYTRAEFRHPTQHQVEDVTKEVQEPLFKADEIERWGFIAHELQETLLDSAASCPKDDPKVYPSPDPWPVIAALTKALQEAQELIEALEFLG